MLKKVFLQIVTYIYSHEERIKNGLIGLFALRLVDSAFRFLPYVVPDEKYHLDLIQLYASHSFPLSLEVVGDVGYGAAVRSPFLYHLIIGWLYRLVALLNVPLPAYILVRCFSITLAIATAVFAYRLLKLVLHSPLVRITVLVLFLNIPAYAYTVMGASYDTLFIFLSTVSVYVLFMLFENIRLNTLLWLLITLFLGIVTKSSFLPLAFLILFIVIPFCISNRGHLWEQIKSFTLISTTTALSLVSIFLFILIGSWFVQNYVQFGAVYPTCEAMYPVERCKNEYNLLRGYVLRADAEPPSVNQASALLAVFVPYWSLLMFFGLLTNNMFYFEAPPQWYVGSTFALALSCLFISYLYRKRISDRKQLLMTRSVLFLGGGYIIFLMLYLYVGQIFLYGSLFTVNGRYLLPVALLLLISVFTFFDEKERTVSLRTTFLCSVIVFSVVVESFRYLYLVPADARVTWFAIPRTIESIDYSYLRNGQHDFFPYDRGFWEELFNEYYVNDEE